MKALVIAGGLPQIELLKQLKDRGISTVLADGNANAIARPYADTFYQIPIFDIEEVKKVAVDENVDFLITVCADQVLLVVAQVSEMLGLPCYIDYKTGMDVSDKIRMKHIFRKYSIPTSDFVEMKEFSESAVSSLSYPLVVKPVDAYSSKGVRKVENFDELRQYYNEAAEISRSGNVIVEEFCPGSEISVDAFVVNGKAHILCVSNSEKVQDEDRFVIFRGRYPVDAKPSVIKEIEEIAQKITDAFGLVNAPLLIQMINDGEHVSVLEFCARTGGNLKYLLIKYSCGVDVISAAIDLAMGIEPDITKKIPEHNIVVNDFIYCKPGIYDHLEGFEELCKDGIITDFHNLRPKGMTVRGVTSSSDRIAGVTICADNKEEFNQKHREFVRRARIIDITGSDIMRHDLLPDLK